MQRDIKAGLQAYLKGRTEKAVREFAESCGTSAGHLRNVMLGWRACSGELAAAIERESQGAVSCEHMAPHIKWHRLRDSAWPWNGGRPVVEVALSA